MKVCESLSEQEVVKQIVDGDIVAKKQLYCRYVPYLTAVCSRYIDDNEDVKDVLHDSFIRIFSSIKTFDYRGGGSLKAWLTRVVVNESLRFLKANCRFDIVQLSEEHEEADEVSDIDGIPASVLHAMIRDLPVGYRTILNLFIFEGKSHREISEQLNIKESTSASQFHRAKILLAEKIKRYNNSNLSVAYEK